MTRLRFSKRQSNDDQGDAVAGIGDAGRGGVVSRKDPRVRTCPVAFRVECLLHPFRGALRNSAAVHGFLRSTHDSVVFLQQFAQPIARQHIDAMVVAADHGMIVNQRVDNRFFGSLHYCREQRVH